MASRDNPSFEEEGYFELIFPRRTEEEEYRARVIEMYLLLKYTFLYVYAVFFASILGFVYTRTSDVICKILFTDQTIAAWKNRYDAHMTIENYIYYKVLCLDQQSVRAKWKNRFDCCLEGTVLFMLLVCVLIVLWIQIPPIIQLFYDVYLFSLEIEQK
jgi:hypothetical protein